MVDQDFHPTFVFAWELLHMFSFPKMDRLRGSTIGYQVVVFFLVCLKILNPQIHFFVSIEIPVLGTPCPV